MINEEIAVKLTDYDNEIGNLERLVKKVYDDNEEVTLNTKH